MNNGEGVDALGGYAWLEKSPLGWLDGNIDDGALDPNNPKLLVEFIWAYSFFYVGLLSFIKFKVGITMGDLDVFKFENKLNDPVDALALVYFIYYFFWLKSLLKRFDGADDPKRPDEPVLPLKSPWLLNNPWFVVLIVDGTFLSLLVLS